MRAKYDQYHDQHHLREQVTKATQTAIERLVDRTMDTTQRISRDLRHICRQSNVGAVIDAAAWEVPPLFRWLRASGSVPADDMMRTFNMGIGMVAVVARESAEGITQLLRDAGETVYTVGEIATGSEPVRMEA